MIVRGEEGLQSGEKTLPARVLGARVIVISRYLLFDHSLIKEFCLETSGRVIFSVPPSPLLSKAWGSMEYGRAIWVATTVQRRIRVVVWYVCAEIRDTR
jgi:hypothetical protein